jgi:hypothetical protein
MATIAPNGKPLDRRRFRDWYRRRSRHHSETSRPTQEPRTRPALTTQGSSYRGFGNRSRTHQTSDFFAISFFLRNRNYFTGGGSPVGSGLRCCRPYLPSGSSEEDGREDACSLIAALSLVVLIALAALTPPNCTPDERPDGLGIHDCRLRIMNHHLVSSIDDGVKRWTVNMGARGLDLAP